MLAAVVGALLAGLLALPLTLLLGAAPASAHAAFTGSDPAEGAQVAELPAAVVMSYSEEIAPQFVETAVVAPDSTTVPTEASVAGADVTVDLAGADLPALPGTWQVVARVVSVDGHPVEHTTSFVVAEAPPSAAPEPSVTTSAPAPGPSTGTAAAPAAPAAPTASSAPQDEPSGAGTDLPADPVAAAGDALPRWVVVAGAAALVLAAAAALLVQLRRRPPTG